MVEGIVKKLGFKVVIIIKLMFCGVKCVFFMVCLVVIIFKLLFFSLLLVKWCFLILVFFFIYLLLVFKNCWNFVFFICLFGICIVMDLREV